MKIIYLEFEFSLLISYKSFIQGSYMIWIVIIIFKDYNLASNQIFYILDTYHSN